MSSSWRHRKWGKIGYFVVVLLFTAFIEIVIIVLGAVPIINLPTELPQNATVVTVLTVVTQRAEISKISSLLLTVDGILLGLSPILFDKVRRKSIGVACVTVTGFALIMSLITIALADGNQDFTTVYRSYFLAVSLFGMVANLYIVSSWQLLLPEQKNKARAT
jgi:hypothetical protein